MNDGSTPGWYDDPGAERFWDGTRWTESTRRHGDVGAQPPIVDPNGVPRPGWLPDPAAQRYWDGTRWTSRHRERAEALELAAAATTVFEQPGQTIVSPSPAADPRTAAPVTHDPGADDSRAWKFAVTGLIAFLLFGLSIAAGLQLSGGEESLSPGNAESDDSGAPGPDTSPAQTQSTAALPTTTTAPACSDGHDSANWPPTTVGPVIECPDYPLGKPNRSLSSDIGWVAVVDSILLNEVARVDRRLAELEGRVGTLALFDTRRHSGLRDPYWAIAAGPFPTRAAIDNFCARNEGLLDSCYPRELDGLP